MNQTESSANPKPAITGATSTVPEWINETVNGGSLRHVDLHTGINGWASPPGNVFSLRSTNYFTNKQKSPGGDYLLSPAGVEWLKSNSKLDNILAHPDNRVAHSLRQAQARGESSENTFIFCVNFHVSSKEHYNLAFYFSTEEPIPSDSVLKRFIEAGDDTFRNHRFKIVSRVVKGPWIVKTAAGRFGAFLVGKTLTCTYHRGPNYFEIDVDTGSSGGEPRVVLEYAKSVTVDVGFVIEAKEEDELPERLIGAVRMCHVEKASASVVKPGRMMGSAEASYDDEGTN
ncbi:Enhanced disease resistance-like protein [Hirschfeldia incana]|nr:Enhanced disease resistance-like protein [Hirschfeldia incana]